MPSIITYFGGIVTVGSLGVTRQHQAVWSRNERPVSPSVSAWESFPSNQVRNLLSSCLRVTSPRLRTEEALQIGHSQRWVPAAVLPFFTRAVLHIRQWVVFDDFGTVKSARP